MFLTIVAGICILFSTGAMAQYTKYSYTPKYKQPTFDTLYKTDIGFNCTELIKNALFFNNLNVVGFYPFDISYRHLKKNRRDFYRAGLSFSFSGSRFIGINSLQFPQTKSNTFTFRSGNERHRLIAKNVVFINGSDFRIGFKHALNNDQTPLGFTNNVTFFMGAAIIAGLEYRVAERFRFSTEVAFMTNFLASNNALNGLIQFPEFGNSVSTGLEVHMMIPTFIVASYAF